MEIREEGSQALIVSGKINPARLKQNQYTTLLLNEALRVEILSPQEVNDIQVQIMLLLKDLIIGYTKGESSSVPTHTAESLLNSMLYAIDAYTFNCSNPEEALKQLKKTPLKRIYKKGIERISQSLEETKILYKEIKDNKLDLELESYNLTIYEAIPLFFNKYGIVFEAHNTMASIDYPLVFDDTTVRGVLYIKNYLEHLKLETDFCKYFSIRDIEKMLNNFGKMIRMDYKIELINIFELVFNNAVFSVLAGNAAIELSLSKYKFELLNEKLRAISSAKIILAIGRGIEKLINILDIKEPKLLDYINKYKTLFIGRVINAAKNDSLNSIIITEREEKKKGNVVFQEGERLCDDDFKSVIEKLMTYRKTADKINLIKSGISSLYDFIDILNSDCLFGEEFNELFNSLGDTELAILAKMVFYEELRGDIASFSSIISKEKEGEYEWQRHYIKFVQKLSEARIISIENCFSEIEYEEIKFY